MSCDKIIDFADHEAQKIMKKWNLEDLDENTTSKIKSSIKDAFIFGVSVGGMDSDMFKESLEYEQDTE